MDDSHDGAHAREPQVEDLIRICRALNEAGARYLLIGGFAVIAHGGAHDQGHRLSDRPFSRNVILVKRALRVLEDHAADDIDDDDVARYAVVRVADKVVVDLMARACGIDYIEAAADAERLTLGDVEIPVASAATLIRTKNTVQPSDAVDRRYLEELIRSQDR